MKMCNKADVMYCIWQLSAFWQTLNILQSYGMLTDDPIQHGMITAVHVCLGDGAHVKAGMLLIPFIFNCHAIEITKYIDMQ